MTTNETSSAHEVCERCGSPKGLAGKTLKEGECNVCVVLKDMWDAIGDILVKHFPEARYGDVSPLVTLALIEAHKGLANEWISNNFTDADHEDDE